jgi:hypothetical protein
MSEFSQDSRLVAEDAQPFAFLVQGDDDVLALNDNSHPSAAIASHDALDDRALGRSADPILAHFEAKNATSGSAENLSRSTAEVGKVCPRIPVPAATNLDHETSEIYSEIKRRIARQPISGMVTVRLRLFGLCRRGSERFCKFFLSYCSAALPLKRSVF